jgi:hypothetical protein
LYTRPESVQDQVSGRISYHNGTVSESIGGQNNGGVYYSATEA